MADINLKTLTPDTSLPTTGFLFGADSQAATDPSVYGVTTAITTILGNAASSDALVFNSDTTFARKTIRNFRFGAADAASPLAQTLSVQSVVAGTSNTAGQNFTITGSQGTGTGAGGSLIFQVAPAGGSGTAQNALSTALTIAGNSEATFTSSGTTLNVNSTLASIPAIGNFLAPNLNIGSTAYINLGRQAGTKNWAGFGFYYAGNGSSSNAFTLAFYGTVNIWGITADTTNTLMFLGGQTSSFPALKRSTTFLHARLADDSAFAGFASANVQAATAYTVATLPATPGTGMIARVSDASAPVIGTTVAGNGAAYALVNYNGANWTVIGV
jgi:hypothetical protein